MTWCRLIEQLHALEQDVADLASITGSGVRRWSDAERQLVRDYYPDTPAWMIARALQRSNASVYQMADRLGVSKAPDWLDNPLSNTTRVDPGRGRVSQFRPGQKPWNTGKKGWRPPGAERTQFKPGQLNGRAAQLVEPVGSYRLDPSGILQRKIATTPGPAHLRWRSVHELVWIEHNGPVPPGHLVVFKEGMRTNVLQQITLDRIECLSRGDLMRRNSYHNRYPKEIARLIQLKGALARKINNRSKAA